MGQIFFRRKSVPKDQVTVAMYRNVGLLGVVGRRSLCMLCTQYSEEISEAPGEPHLPGKQQIWRQVLAPQLLTSPSGLK